MRCRPPRSPHLRSHHLRSHHRQMVDPRALSGYKAAYWVSRASTVWPRWLRVSLHRVATVATRAWPRWLRGRGHDDYENARSKKFIRNLDASQMHAIRSTLLRRLGNGMVLLKREDARGWVAIRKGKD
jgi:hypothetical protein